MKHVRVAAIQMESTDGALQANLARATRLVEHAAGQVAQLVLLPELMPTGYRLTQDLWVAVPVRAIQRLPFHAKLLAEYDGSEEDASA